MNMVKKVGKVGKVIEVGEVSTGDILFINGKKYYVGEWVIGDGFNLTGINHPEDQENNPIKN